LGAQSRRSMNKFKASHLDYIVNSYLKNSPETKHTNSKSKTKNKVKKPADIEIISPTS
jgi:hypothetical protein